MVWPFRTRRYTRRMDEDDVKVAAYLRKLNKGNVGHWVASEGFNIWLKFQFGKKGAPNNIDAGQGIVVKVFFNDLTGEVKTVLAQAMVKDGN